MDNSLPSRLALPEHRLALLREMAGSLAQAQAAVISSDLASLEYHTERQRLLCQQLQALYTQPIPSLPSSTPGDALSPALSEAETEVQRRLRVYGALLRRARRTVGIFCRVLATSGVTYIVPPPEATTPGKL
jgi:hypothetical protein